VVEWRGDKKPLFVAVAANGAIAAFSDEKIDDESSALVTAGVYLFSTRIFEHSRSARARRLGALRQYLALLIEQRMRFAALPMTDVIDVDEGADLALARASVARQGR
jgi:NDP-sugar pyrophosphorylase family protein